MTRSINNKGFNLIEVMVASGVLLIVLSGLLLSFVYGILLNQSNNNLVIAANDAQYALEQIKGLASATEISNYTPPQFNHLDNEVITLTRSMGTKVSEVTVNVI